jgi:hypothetical protein
MHIKEKNQAAALRGEWPLGDAAKAAEALSGRIDGAEGV